MTAHSYIRVDSEYFLACREDVLLELATVFRDDERGPGKYHEYVCSVGDVSERLDALGFSVHESRKLVDRARRSVEGHGEEPESFDDWVNEIGSAVAGDGSGGEVPDWAAWSVDPRAILRLVLAACPHGQEVALDLGDVVGAGHVQPGSDFCLRAFEQFYGSEAARGPLIVMTEGSTDAECLELALRVLDPHLKGYVRVLDYEFRPEGSATALVRAIKAFAAAGVTNRIVALFDRDSAAAEVMTALPPTLPDNFRAITLPESKVGREYPTIGPNGAEAMNINGLALSIELFFGEDILTSTSGQLPPIQWTGYMSKVGRYQGEVLNKRGLQEAFRRRARNALGRGCTEPNEDWSGMSAVLQEIKSAFLTTT